MEYLQHQINELESELRRAKVRHTVTTQGYSSTHVGGNTLYRQWLRQQEMLKCQHKQYVPCTNRLAMSLCLLISGAQWLLMLAGC